MSGLDGDIDGNDDSSTSELYGKHETNQFLDGSLPTLTPKCHNNNMYGIVPSYSNKFGQGIMDSEVGELNEQFSTQL